MPTLCPNLFNLINTKKVNNITKTLETGPKTLSQLIELTEVPRTTLLRVLTDLESNGLVIKDGSSYKLSRPVPSRAEIASDMAVIHQQKLMDKNYRKLSNEKKMDEVLVWYIDNQLKGRVDDYHYETLVNETLAGWNKMMSEHNIYIRL